jgi:anaerobic magnesium-protoporphyrin IX monomethyl ester cyclase
MSARRKVVLYNPRAVFWTMPLGLLAVGSHLPKDRYDVVVVDGRLEEDPVAALLERLPGALALGVSVLTGAPIRDALAVSRAAKARFPDLPVVWGGWHPSLFGTDCLEEPSVDATVQAQGEETFADILGRLADGASLVGCAGCACRDEGGTPVQNPARTFAPVQGFAPHDYSLLPVERYFERKGKRQLDYIASQGCRFRCAFCADPWVYGRQWSGLSPERLGEELSRLHREHRFDDVNFQDETFFTSLSRVDAIAGEILRRGLPISWAATMRADQGARLTDDVMARARRSGLRRVLLGVEAGSQEMLDRIRKDIRLEEVFASAEKCLRHGVRVQFPFIVAFPGESDESIRTSLRVARKLRAMSPLFETPIFYFKPYPGTPLTEEAVRGGYRPPRTLDDWARFDVYDADSPWVTPERKRLVERFKYYQRLGYGEPKPWAGPFRGIARWRCEREAFAFPVEKAVGELLFPAPALS